MSSVLSIQPSANFMVKIPTSSGGQNSLKVQITGKFPSIHTSLDSSVNRSVTLSQTESPLKFPGNHG